MSKAVIDVTKCDQSDHCKAKKQCPVDAFERVDGKWHINDDCLACGACVDYCCMKCIEIED
ncbi:MAG: ferredoxin [Thermincola sp.]|jgi:Fe-S-cluster-containing hydrogenase component 2|nr:ferredoxin [Thermincola sp.]MDT3703015.1 ferredoxin [Thermincola sp.]